nr:MAG: major capsid protein [Microviridae sp.]
MHSVPSVQSRAQHTFARSPQANIQRASFDRSHGYKTTFYEGNLLPIFVDEVLPGDTFNLKMTAFARLATPIFPIMDNLYLETFFFFVPNRLVWDQWQAFNGEQKTPTSSTDFVLPTITAPDPGVQTGDIGDYMGLPINIVNLEFQALPLRAYNLIWNEWFRDENMQDSVPQYTGDGPDAYADYVIQRRGKRHDYFTSCLPWPQKINDGTVVEIPLGTTAPLVAFNTGAVDLAYGSSSGSQLPMYVDSATGGPYTSGATHGSTDQMFWPTVVPNIQVDLSSATAATINQLRQSFQLQRLFEHDARGGTRYTEIIRSHFGVISPDARLQRPEYLGGGTSMVNISPVAQTSPAVSDSAPSNTPQGNLAAFGTAHAINHGFVKSFTEHGHIIGLVSTRADINYQQGLARMWSRSTRYDFYWPSLSHIGEQAVLNQEIYCQGTPDDTAVFGYQERYAEYRYKPALITGLFRSAATGSLDAWHLAQDFGSLPTLNYNFIAENAPMSRIVAVPSQPDFIFDAFFSLKCVRPMSLYGVPGWTDQF